MKTLGARLRELRETKDLSLRELAKKLGGISAAHISDIELGRRFPSEELMEKMAGVFGIRLDELRAHDTRPPIEDLKRLTESDPMTYGVALRKIVDMSPDEVRKLLDLHDDRQKRGKK